MTALTWLQLSTLPVGTRLVYHASHLKLTDDTPIPPGSHMLIVMQGLNELTAELWLRPYDEELLAKLKGDEEECLRFYVPKHAPNGWAGESLFTLANDGDLDLETLAKWWDAHTPPPPPATIDAVDIPQAPAAFYSVAIYLVDKAYGGPEEGGWWYNYGIRQDVDFSKQWDLLNNTFGNHGIPRIFDSEESACAWCENVNMLLDATLNKGRRDISSVLSTGKYRAMVHDNYPPHHWPELTPHYE